MIDAIDIAIALVKLLLFVVWLLLIPVALLVASPFVLLWPRSDDSTSYTRVILLRYWKVIWIWGLFAEAADAGVDDPIR